MPFDDIARHLRGVAARKIGGDAKPWLSCCIPPPLDPQPRILAMLRQHGHMPDCCGFCAQRFRPPDVFAS